MSGVTLNIDYDDRLVQAAMERLVRAGNETEQLAGDIGEHLLISHRERWEDQESPTGEPWEPLSPRYQARKKKNTDKILVLDGFLRDLLSYEANADGVLFGTNSIYGATHQFGDDDRGVPARPWLGLSAQDERDILDIVLAHYESALEG